MVLGFRWRRDGWLVGALVLAVVIVAAAAVYRSDRRDPVAAPSGAATSATPLPEGAIAAPEGRQHPAELVYACVRGCRPVVRLTDGSEFTVPTDAPSTREVTLSPDGRWLGYPVGAGFVVRDLLGAAQHRSVSLTPDRRVRAWAWTADSRRLLLAEVRDGQPEAYVLLELEGGRTEVAAWPGHEIIGVRSPAELLTIRPDVPAGTRAEAGLSEPTGTMDRWFTVDTGSHLRAGERIEPTSLRFSGSGYEIVVVDADDGPVAVLRFAGAEGGAVRHDLPGPGAGRWSVLGIGDDGRAFVRNGPEGTEVWYLTGDGSLRAGPSLPGDAVVVTPGTARN